METTARSAPSPNDREKIGNACVRRQGTGDRVAVREQLAAESRSFPGRDVVSSRCSFHSE